MNKNILIPIVSFIAGAIMVMILMDRCNNKKMDEVSAEVKTLADSVKKISYENEVLTADKMKLSLEREIHDSVNRKTIDSLRNVIKIVKSAYYSDTVKFKRTIQNLQSAFDNKDSAKAQAALDSLIIEARSANWEATNLFYQYGELDSTWRLQKAYDDSVYHVLLVIDSSKDSKFNALLRINTQLGSDYEKSLKQIDNLKKGKKFWFVIGVLLGAATNFLHK
jgi:outer membrane murein-binding lipoprotein Lpp